MFTVVQLQEENSLFADVFNANRLLRVIPIVTSLALPCAEMAKYCQLFTPAAGKKLEPLEEVVCEVEDPHAGEVIEAVTLRKGEVRCCCIVVLGSPIC